MSDCTHELEDLLVEVFESLATDGPILPEYVARKLHGMVHLHRLCSHRYSSDFVDTSCLECGEARRSNQTDIDELLTPEEAETDVEASAVLARPELVVEDAPAWIAIQKQNEHPELLIECDSDDDDDDEDDDGFVPRSDWASSQDHPEIVIELEGPSVQSTQPEIVIELEHEPNYMAALSAHPELVIEVDATPVTATETSDEVSHVNGDEEADDVAEMQSPSFLALPAIEEEDVDTCSVASTMDVLELAGKPLANLPSVPQSSETLSMHSDDETVTSVDLDLENIQSLNNEYDEFFEFMNQQLETESPEEMPSPRAAYTPAHSSSSDASDSDDDDDDVRVLYSPKAPATTSPCSSIAKGQTFALNSPKLSIMSSPKPSIMSSPKPSIMNSPKPSIMNSPMMSVTKSPVPSCPKPCVRNSPKPSSISSPNPCIRSSSKPSMIAKLCPTPLSLANDVKSTPVRPSAIARPRLEIAVPKEKATTSSPLQMTRRSGIPPPPLSTCGVASVDRKAMTMRRNSAAIPSAPRSSNGSNASSCSSSSKASVTPLKRTVSAPRLTSRSSTASQCSSVTTTRGPSATPKKLSVAPTPRKPLATPVTPRTTDQRHELVAKRREEKERREAQAREEALKQREERRLLLEAKMQAEKDARAELVRKRLLERDDHLLKRHV